MAKTKMRIDVMSITILLVMTIFGGLIGFYIGQSAGANQVLQATQTR
jgi:hypothetical protein